MATRFCRHLLPRQFTRIRHYGILANNCKHRDVPQARLLLLSRRTLTILLALQASLGSSQQIRPCPRCRTGQMQLLRVIKPTRSHRCRPP